MKRREQGFVTIEFVLAVAFLILPVALLVAVLPTWSERQLIARTAAQEAARTYVTSGDEVAAREAAFQVARNGRIDANGVEVSFEGDPRQPGSVVSSTVQVEIPVTVIPLLDNDGGAFEVSESHSEAVDLYRSQPQ